MSLALVAELPRQPALTDLTLEELAEIANREHDAALQATLVALEHAIRAGEALIAAKQKVPKRSWTSWLAQNFADKSVGVAQLYMRIARHQELVRSEGVPSVKAAKRFLQEGGVGVGTSVEREAAIEMHRAGATYREIAAEFEVSATTAYAWCHPDRAREHRRRERKRNKAARRAAQKQAQDRAVKKHGGALAEGYALIRRALQSLERAVDEEESGAAVRLIRVAEQRLYAAEDALGEAVRLG